MIDRIEITNFKSFKGNHSIPFAAFTSVIGPNGAGKSNLMDAISFVLGIKSSLLRSTQLQELIYNINLTSTTGKVAAEGEDSESEEGGDDTDKFPTSCSVALYYTSTPSVDSDSSKKKGSKGKGGGSSAPSSSLKDVGATAMVFKRSVLDKGVGEYRINNKTCTYSQYLSTLEAENILVKARNFLVFQGDVEAVASQSPKDLTLLIEQISGSLELKGEYDRLKATLEKATEASSANFIKKRANTAEVKAFKEQQAEAEKHAKLSVRKMKLVQIQHLWKLYHLEKQLSTLRGQLEDEQEASLEFTETQKQLEEELKQEKKAYAKLNKQVLTLTKQHKDMDRARIDLKPEMYEADESLKHIEAKLATSNENSLDAKASLDTQTKNLKVLEKDLKTIDARIAAHQEAVAEEQKKKQHIVLNANQQATYSKLRESVTTQTFKEKTRLKSLKQQMQSVNDSANRYQSSLQSMEKRGEELVEEKEGLLEKKQMVESKIKDVTNNLKQSRKKLGEIEGERRRLHQLEIEANEKLTEIVNRLLQARVEKHESERASKFKETLESLKRLYPGVLGRIVDLCKPTQRKYEAAVAVIMGKNMDSIVVDSEKTAIDCIKYMRDQRAGQATFLPLDTITVKPTMEKYRSFVKGARLAVDIINFDTSVERAIKYVVGNALVSDTMELARHIVYEKKQEVKVVTLDGTVLHKTGMITGGVGDRDSSNAQRWQEREVDELKKQRDVISHQLEDISKRQRKASQDEHLFSEVTILETRLSVMEEELSAITQKIESCSTEIETIKQESRDMKSDHQQTLAAIRKLEGEIDTIDELVQKAEQETFADFCKTIKVRNIREYESSTLKATQEQAERTLELETARAKINSLISFDQQRFNETQAKIETIAKRIVKLEKSRDDALSQKKALIAKSKKCEADIEKIQGNLEKVRAELETQGTTLIAAKDKITKWNQKFEGMSRNISKLESQIELCLGDRIALIRKCKLEEIKLPLVNDGSLEDLVLEELNRTTGEDDEDAMDVDKDQNAISLDDIQFNYHSLTKEHRQNSSNDFGFQFENDIRELELEMEKLAPNLRVLSKIDEVEKKFKETASEFDQTRQEAKQAKEAFQKVKQERYEKFQEAYQFIADNIDKIYKELTKSANFPLGGTAYLSLEDSDEPYLDGIKYHAMPPMKRFREMELLSGGEKTMVALALLFAIHSYKPSPFFILDEVDAALDNTNVRKMTSYIKTRSGEDFQFIVISLKSMFYENADSLVGVYRDPKLLSSGTLSLDLTGRVE